MINKLLMLILTFWITANISAQTNYHVSNSGSNSNDGLTPGMAFLTIQFAADLVVAGDSVFIEDGTYDDVIIALRQGTMADCFYGKVTVKEGNVDYKNMYLTFEDGTYEKLENKFRYQAKPIKIINGISTVILTEEDQLINLDGFLDGLWVTCGWGA